MKYCKVCIGFTDVYEEFVIDSDTVYICDDCIDIIRNDYRFDNSTQLSGGAWRCKNGHNNTYTEVKCYLCNEPR